MKGKLQPAQAHAERLPFADASFERVVVVDALHHFRNQREAVGDLLRILKPGGRLVIEEPDIHRLIVKFIALGEKVALMRSRFYSVDQIRDMFAAQGYSATPIREESAEMTRGTVVLKLGDDVSTDIIYPGRFMATVLPTETPQFAFADNAELNGMLKAKQVPPGSVIVAGKNFGCGSSREQACSCLKGYELTIVARGFARIFLQNSINLGLNLVTAPEIEASEGDELEVTADTVVNKTTGKTFAVVPLPKARQAIIDAGGLIAYTRKRVMEAAQRGLGAASASTS